MGITKFTLYIDTLCVLDEMDDRQAGKLFKAIKAYWLRKAERCQQDASTGFDSLMEDFRKALETAREQNSGEPEDFCYMDAEQAREMIFAMCDRLDDPKEVMQHVRTACEMLEVWEPERNRAAN